MKNLLQGTIINVIHFPEFDISFVQQRQPKILEGGVNGVGHGSYRAATSSPTHPSPSNLSTPPTSVRLFIADHLLLMRFQGKKDSPPIHRSPDIFASCCIYSIHLHSLRPSLPSVMISSRSVGMNELGSDPPWLVQISIFIQENSGV